MLEIWSVSVIDATRIIEDYWGLFCIIFTGILGNPARNPVHPPKSTHRPHFDHIFEDYFTYFLSESSGILQGILHPNACIEHCDARRPREVFERERGYVWGPSEPFRSVTSVVWSSNYQKNLPTLHALKANLTLFWVMETTFELAAKPFRLVYVIRGPEHSLPHAQGSSSPCKPFFARQNLWLPKWLQALCT